MKDIPINVFNTSGGIGVVPTRANVGYGSDDVRLVWRAKEGATFSKDPSGKFFEWSSAAIALGAPTVSWVSDVELTSAIYQNDKLVRRVWDYKILVNDEWVDPEVNNQPPGGPMYRAQ